MLQKVLTRNLTAQIADSGYWQQKQGLCGIQIVIRVPAILIRLDMTFWTNGRLVSCWWGDGGSSGAWFLSGIFVFRAALTYFLGDPFFHRGES